ncbi:MAG: DsbA family oxidoreductase [Propionivibrio sp.]|nr:DsbA family oxidoreductase [Propionivibrio sp.]
MNLAIDIVSDPVCPWCFIGKHRLTSALALVREKYPEVRFQFNWLPFFLNPDTPPQGEPYRAFLETKFGGAQQVNTLQQQVVEAGRDAGVRFDFERIALRPNTMRAHRLIYRAQSIGHRPEDVQALVERLFIGHFQRGEDIGDIATLAEIAAECGDRKGHVIEYLESHEGTAQVRSLVSKVGELGVSGVPYFLIQRRLAVAGAQSSVVLAAAIMQTMM